MDTKKTINVILILVVLSLWGTVGYKYINRFFDVDELTYTNSNVYNYDAISIIKKDTFELQPLVKDPFLNKAFSKPITAPIIVRSIPVIKKEPEPKVIIPFPLVQYLGYIKSKDKKEELILVKINNRLKRVRLNSDIDGLVIKKIYKDSVVVSFNKVIKVVSKR